jgi:hypothetical protein
MTPVTDATAQTAGTDVPPVERQLATDLVRRGVLVAPLLLVLGLPWGADGVASAALAIALVLVNFVLVAASLGWAATKGATALMATALGGFAARMGLIVAVLFAVRDASWVDFTALAIAVLVTHLGLLVWETRYVSASLAFPGLKPTPTSRFWYQKRREFRAVSGTKIPKSGGHR